MVRKLDSQISEGKDLLERYFVSSSDFKEGQHERTKWEDYNIELLRQSFDPEGVAEDYARISVWGAITLNASLHQQIESFKEGVARKIAALEFIKKRLELFRESAASESGKGAIQAGHHTVTSSDSVFVVHGSDDSVKESVARLIERLSLKAIILHEVANEGRTVIEKFEHHAARVGFAAVLLTADDVGARRSEAENLRPRARQNVILELGYFSAKLGRERTCVLYEEGVELPSDMAGVVYVPLDSAGAWRLRLAKEIKVAGLSVDLNDVI